MRRLRSNDIHLTLFVLAVLAAVPAFARPADEPASASPPCALVDGYSGIAQILDDSREKMEDAGRKKAIPCGGWISVEEGWVSFRHRDGYRVHLAAGSFAQIPDVARGVETVILFRGQAYAQAEGGTGKGLRVLTPNARAGVTRGSVIVSFHSDEERTQVVAVDGGSWVENRFGVSRRSSLKAGQFSNLDFKLLRVMPSVPRAIATASLKEKLKELHVPERQRERAILFARHRQEEVFTPAPVERTPSEAAEGSRGLASTESGKAAEKKRPAPDTFSATEDESFHERMISRLTAGEPSGEKILYPGRSGSGHGVNRRVSGKRIIVVEDPAAKLRAQESQAEEAEKKKLIEELSGIRSE